MRPTAPRRTRAAATLLAAGSMVLALAAGCSSAPPEGTPPIPTFGGPGAAVTPDAPPPRDTLLPTDCNTLLDASSVPNLLGLPLGSVESSALRDIPAPDIGRLERVTCTYSSIGGPAAPPPDATVLTILSSGYTTPAAADAQVQVNAQIEQEAGVEGVPTPLGAAEGLYYDDPDGPLLVVQYGRVTTSLTLGASPVPRDQARAVLADLAQRILPVLVPSTGTPS